MPIGHSPVLTRSQTRLLTQKMSESGHKDTGDVDQKRVEFDNETSLIDLGDGETFGKPNLNDEVMSLKSVNQRMNEMFERMERLSVAVSKLAGSVEEISRSEVRTLGSEDTRWLDILGNAKDIEILSRQELKNDLSKLEGNTEPKLSTSAESTTIEETNKVFPRSLLENSKRNGELPTLTDNPWNPLGFVDNENQFSLPTQPSVQTALNNNLSEIRFQKLWVKNPETWFATLEKLFKSRRITNDQIKYCNLLQNLGPEATQEIAHSLRSLPSHNLYGSLKNIVLRKFGLTKEEKLARLFQHKKRVDQKPSEYLEELVDLSGGQFPRTTILALWKQNLPKSILFLVDEEPIEANEQKMLRKADHIHSMLLNDPTSINAINKDFSGSDVEYSQVEDRLNDLTRSVNEMKVHQSKWKKTHLANQSNSRGGSKSPSNRGVSPRATSASRPRYCHAHCKYGAKAYKCTGPCEWKTLQENGAKEAKNNYTHKSKSEKSEN